MYELNTPDISSRGAKVKTIKIITIADDVQIQKTSEFIADFFVLAGWEVQLSPYYPDSKLRSVYQGGHARIARTISFAPAYVPEPDEQTLFWLLDAVIEGVHRADSAQRARYASNFRVGKVLVTTEEARQHLQGLARNVDVLHLPPFIIGEVLPGPYNNAIVIEQAADARNFDVALLSGLSTMLAGAPLELKLAGFEKKQVLSLEQELKSTGITVEFLTDPVATIDAMRNAMAYVAVGMQGQALVDRAERAAAARKPLIIFGRFEAALLDFFADGTSGFAVRNTQKLIQLLGLLASRKIDVSRLGENAVRLLLHKRQPETTLMEYFK